MKNEYVELFNKMHPDFFKQEYIRNIPENLVYEEMVLNLQEFNEFQYTKAFDTSVSFGIYTGSHEELLDAVDKVDKSWLALYKEDSEVYVATVDGEIASFCLIEDMKEHVFLGHSIKVGGPGCVGTVPAFRNKGLGLVMISKVTQILKERGYDISYIHYTGVAKWYAKLGYETVIKWNSEGVL